MKRAAAFKSMVDGMTGMMSDDRKRFLLMEGYAGQTAQLPRSLDVVYHLVEDDVYASYMETLFAAGERFVIVYSSNSEHNEPGQARHVRHRIFTRWVEANMPDWVLLEHLANRHPLSAPDGQGSLADFYFYQKRSGR